VILAEPSAESLDPGLRQHLQSLVRSAVHDLLQVGTAKTFLLRPHALRKTSSGKISHRTMRTLFLEGRLDEDIL
jgi:hypothetical protein